MDRSPAPGPKSRVLTVSEQRVAIGRLEARIKELGELPVDSVRDRDPRIAALEQRIYKTLAFVYGEDSAEYSPLKESFDAMSIHFAMIAHPTSNSNPRLHAKLGIETAIAVLSSEVIILKEHLEFSSTDVTQTDVPVPAKAPVNAKLSNEVFVVHGRDEAAKETVARTLQRAGLTPIILHEQASGGRTVIEKFEKHGSAVGFAVVIATPDDIGGLAVQPPDKPQLLPRARQNVIGEMFWFAGRLGRDKVCALVKGDVDMPSDFAGVVYTPMDAHGGWKSKLLQELDAAGYKNLNWPAALS
jgi:predicted nucleotide-binding protein